MRMAAEYRASRNDWRCCCLDFLSFDEAILILVGGRHAEEVTRRRE